MLNLLHKLSRNNTGIVANLKNQLFPPTMGLLIELISHSYINMNSMILGLDEFEIVLA